MKLAEGIYRRNIISRLLGKTRVTRVLINIVSFCVDLYECSLKERVQRCCANVYDNVNSYAILLANLLNLDIFFVCSLLRLLPVDTQCHAP